MDKVDNVEEDSRNYAFCVKRADLPTVEPTIPLSVIEDIKAEIEELGIWHEKLLIETIDIKRVIEIIDRKVNEVKDE